MSEAPALIAIDWGTTSLRAWLLGRRDGRVLDERAEPWGIMRVPDGDFAAAFDAVTGAWRARWPGLRAIAAGMVGSAQGWVPAPYCPCPAGGDELAAALTPAHAGALHVVPGVADLGEPPDVMRGEETQILGAIERHPALAARSLLVLPGTHSKWARVADGRVHGFTTYMTGELFAVLRDHSILGRPARDAEREADREADPADAEAAFARGVQAARAGADGGVAPRLFATRALVLTGRMAPASSVEYLSGLLIGDEVRAALRAVPEGAAGALALVGEPALCRRYAEALRLFGVDGVPIVDGAARAGLWHIAVRAGLVAAGNRG